MSTGQLSRPLPSLTFRRVRALALLAALICLISGVVNLVQAGVRYVTAGESQQQVAPAPSPPPTSASATSQLSEAVARRNRGANGRLSVMVSDLDTGVTAAVETDQAFTTASIVKVDILATLLLQRDGDLSPRLQAVARRMIENSDNGAATTLWRQIGGVKGLAEGNRRLGLTSTVGASRGRWGVTSTTAADQTRLLTAVFTDRSPLDPDSRRYLRTLMGSIAPDQDWGISAADSRAGSKFHVKNGWLPRAQGWVVNSIGSVNHHGHRLLIVTLSDGRRSKDAGVKTLELVARDAARAVTGG
jgi:beta-lactamase class A